MSLIKLNLHNHNTKDKLCTYVQLEKFSSLTRIFREYISVLEFKTYMDNNDKKILLFLKYL